MPADSAPPPSETWRKLVIRNIGYILSGRMEEPVIEADCLIAIDGKVAAR